MITMMLLLLLITICDRKKTGEATMNLTLDDELEAGFHDNGGITNTLPFLCVVCFISFYLLFCFLIFFAIDETLHFTTTAGEFFLAFDSLSIRFR